MGLWSRFFGSKQTGSSTILAGLPGAVYPNLNFENLILHAFKGNEVVNRALCIKAASLAAAPLTVYRKRDDEELPDHKLRQLIHIPNRWMSEYDYWETISFHLDIAGNAYIQKVRNAGRRIAYLWLLRPDRVKALVSAEQGLIAYEHQFGATKQIIMPEDLIHIRMNDPSNPWIGTPPIIAAARRIAIDNEASNFAKSMLQNRAIPGLVIETEQKLDEDMVTRLKERWRQSFSGNKRGEPMFIQKGMSVTTVGLNMKELAFNELNATDEARILMVLGVPPSVVGAKVGLDRNTFSNAEEARRSFYEDTIEPLMNRIDDAFDRQLVPDFGQDIYCRFSTKNIAAYRSIRTAKREEALKGFIAGGLTVNEYRTAMNLDTVSGGDVFLRGLAMIPTPIKQIPAKHYRVKKKSDERVALIARAIGRTDEAELWLEKMTGVARTELKAQANDVKRVVNDAAKSEMKRLTPEQEQYILQYLDEFNLSWAKRTQEGFLPLFAEIIKDAGQAAAADLGVDILMSNDEALKFISDYSFKFAEGLTLTSVDEVRAILELSKTEGLTLKEMQQRLSHVFDGWNKTRVEMIARTETIRSANYGAEEGMRQAGVTRKEWLTSGDGCPDCLEMNGRVISIGGNFIDMGGTLPASGRVSNYEEIQAPPLHPNCRCTILASLDLED